METRTEERDERGAMRTLTCDEMRAVIGGADDMVPVFAESAAAESR